MKTKESFMNKLIYKLFRIVFIVCAVYFLLMACGLIFLPHILTQGIAAGEVSPAIIGMLRGAGGAILPYPLLYILILKNPFKRLWALPVILFANMAALTLDLVSIVINEYRFSYAMYDIPVEVLSMAGLWLIWSIRPGNIK